MYDESEDGFGPPTRGDDETDLDITPMIDVTFLLLIFFMVSSTMQAQPDLDVPPVKHGVGEDGSRAMIIMVARPISEEEDPEIVFEGSSGGTIEDLKTFIADQMREENKSHVIIKADRDVPHGFVQRVARAIIEFEGLTFSIGVQDKK